MHTYEVNVMKKLLAEYTILSMPGNGGTERLVSYFQKVGGARFHFIRKSFEKVEAFTSDTTKTFQVLARPTG